jgi:CRISPR-associated endonuclease Cas2
MVQNKIRIYDSSKQLLLYFLVGGGILVLSMFSPQLPYQILKAYLKKKKFDKRKFNRSIKRLEDQGMVTISQEGEETVIRLTKKGKERALKYKLEDMEIKKPKKWDGKWRIVIFDIPEKKKLARNVLRDKLKELGFERVQKSVFVHPYPCRDEIDFIKEVYEIAPYVQLVTAESFDEEERTKNKFFINNS